MQNKILLHYATALPYLFENIVELGIVWQLRILNGVLSMSKICWQDVRNVEQHIFSIHERKFEGIVRCE